MLYTLFSSESTVHVLSPNEVVDAVRATVITATHSVVAAAIVPADIWGTSIGIDRLRRYASNVDWVIDNTAAVAGIGTQSIDANGLLQHNVTYVVSYTPPDSPGGELTIEADVPNVLLEQPLDYGPSGGAVPQPALIIAQAEAALQAMAAG